MFLASKLKIRVVVDKLLKDRDLVKTGQVDVKDVLHLAEWFLFFLSSLF